MLNEMIPDAYTDAGWKKVKKLMNPGILAKIGEDKVVKDFEDDPKGRYGILQEYLDEDPRFHKVLEENGIEYEW